MRFYFKFLIVIILLIFFVLPSNFIHLSPVKYFNSLVYAQSKFIFNPQNTTIAIISEPEGFTKINVSSEILKGILAIKKEFPISLILLTPESYEKVGNQIQLAIQSNSNIIIGYGKEIKNEFIKYADDNPNIFFIGIDMFSNDIEMDQFLKSNNLKNLNMIIYKEEEAGFLAGIFAGFLTKDYNNVSNRLNPDNILGVVLTKKDDSKTRYEFGFNLGVLSVNKDCQIFTSEIDDENDFYLIRKTTSSLYQNNADIIFQLCGKGSPAAIQAAYLGNNFIIGYEYDQNIFAPDNVVTSAIKKISVSLYYYLKKSFLFGFSSGVLRLGIKDGAVGLASFHEFDLLIPQQIKDAIFTVSNAIAEGKINIPFVSMTMKDSEENFNNNNSSSSNGNNTTSSQSDETPSEQSQNTTENSNDSSNNK